MKLDTIGKNIRKFRLARKLRQEDLAEKTDLTTNYIGMVERGEKIPSLETFIKIVNALSTLRKSKQILRISQVLWYPMSGKN